MITNDKIIDLHINGKFTYGEIAKNHNISRNKVAGIIWRYNNPGMHKKGVKSTDHFHVPPYGLRQHKS